MSALITAEELVRLDAALAWIEEHPEQHHQGMWFMRSPECGTTMCLAGVVALVAGAEPVWDDDADATGRVLPPGRPPQGVALYAEELLGTKGMTTISLFYDANDLADLREARDRLAASLVGAS